MELGYEWTSKLAESAITQAVGKLREQQEMGNFHAFVESLEAKPVSESQQLTNVISEGLDVATSHLAANADSAVVEGELFYKLFTSTSHVGEHAKPWTMVVQAVRDLAVAQNKKPIFQSTSLEDAKASVHAYSGALRALDERLRTARCSNGAKHAELQRFVAQIQEQLPRHRGSFSETLHDLMDKLCAEVESRTARLCCSKVTWASWVVGFCSIPLFRSLPPHILQDGFSNSEVT